MTGNDVYRLSVYLRRYNNGGWLLKKDLVGETEDMVWYNAIVPLNGISYDFQVDLILFFSATVINYFIYLS